MHIIILLFTGCFELFFSDLKNGTEMPVPLKKEIEVRNFTETNIAEEIVFLGILRFRKHIL